MDMFQHHISNKEELKRINTCRQYVHVIYLSDITTANGNHIDPEYFHNKKHESSLHWPNIHHPPNQTWNAWKKAIIHICCQHKETTRLKQHMQLGTWTKPMVELQKNGHMHTPTKPLQSTT